ACAKTARAPAGSAFEASEPGELPCRCGSTCSGTTLPLNDAGALLRACHASTLIRTLPACLGAFLAMRMLVLCALASAGLADVRAKCADLLREVAASRHEGRCKPADGGTVHVQANALGHVL